MRGSKPLAMPLSRLVADTLRSYFALWAIGVRLDLSNHELSLSRLVPFQDARALAECPVYALHDIEEVGIAPGSVHLIHRISEIIETEDLNHSFSAKTRKFAAAIGCRGADQNLPAIAAPLREAQDRNHDMVAAATQRAPCSSAATQSGGGSCVRWPSATTKRWGMANELTAPLVEIGRIAFRSWEHEWQTGKHEAPWVASAERTLPADVTQPI